ncbi:MAG: response regulator [Suipraeoptans sp.]
MLGRILLVDDDFSYANSFKAVMEDAGYEVNYISCAVEAIKEYAKTPLDFDMVIAEYMSGGFEGLDSFKLISILKGINKSLKCIFLTSSSNEEIEIKALEMSADRFISKDKSLKVITHYVDDLMRRLRR